MKGVCLLFRLLIAFLAPAKKTIKAVKTFILCMCFWARYPPYWICTVGFLGLRVGPSVVSPSLSLLDSASFVGPAPLPCRVCSYPVSGTQEGWLQSSPSVMHVCVRGSSCVTAQPLGTGSWGLFLWPHCPVFGSVHLIFPLPTLAFLLQPHSPLHSLLCAESAHCIPHWQAHPQEGI